MKEKITLAKLRIQLRKEIKTCTSCSLHRTRKQAVPFSGPTPARIAFIGEGPGEQENIQGIPFVGKAGQLFNQLLEEINLNRKDVFVCNTVCCRPPGNRKPLKDELESCNRHLRAQITLARPEIIVLLGATALSCFSSEKITYIHGRFFEQDKQLYFPIFHPSAGLRDEFRLRDIRKDMQILRQRLVREEEKFDTIAQEQFDIVNKNLSKSFNKELELVKVGKVGRCNMFDWLTNHYPATAKKWGKIEEEIDQVYKHKDINTFLDALSAYEKTGQVIIKLYTTWLKRKNIPE